MDHISPHHPLAVMLADLVHEQVAQHIGQSVPAGTQAYLADLLLDFMRTDRLYRIRTHDGKPVETIIELLAQGDVRLFADSFDREREVHKHIGDTILFWMGFYPQRFGVGSASASYVTQGRQSYHLVSTFDHKPYDSEAPIFEDLSMGFEDFAFVLHEVGRKSGLHVA